MVVTQKTAQQTAEVPGVHYATVSDARSRIKRLIDASEAGQPATVTRDDTRVAILDAGRLRSTLAHLIPSNAEAVSEAGRWSIFIPGLAVAADGTTFDEALDDMVLALREYAQDWTDRLRLAPNHSDNWGLVQLIALSDDQQIKDWLLGER